MQKLAPTLCRSLRPWAQSTAAASSRWSFQKRSLSLAYGTSAVPEPSRILSVQLKERDLSLEWNNNGWVDLPYIYLRDNCQEPESFKRQRLFHAAFTIDLNIQAKQAEVKEDGRLVIITWPDGHRSRFPSEWLAEYCRGKHNVSGQLDVGKVYWGSDFYDSMPRFDFSMLMKDDKSLLEYLIALESHGLVLIENVGLQEQQTKALCDRIYYPKPCIYGKDVMKVESKLNPSHIAYSGVELPLHNGLVYTDHTSGIQMLHFIHQASGPANGASRFSDGVNAARELKNTNRAAFDMLSQYPIQFVDSGTDLVGDYDTESWHFPISVDQNGDITSVAYSDHSRGPHFPHILMDKLHEWYKAYYAFSQLLNSPKYLIEFKVLPGQMVVFDNTRVLHGRSEFQLNSADNYRCAELTYMDWDEIRSKARVLMKKLS